MTARFLAAFIVASGVVLVADSEFDQVTRAIEVHYHTKRTHIPFLGVANFFVKVTRPAGTSEFKLAVFEDLKDLDRSDERDLDRFMYGLSSSRLRPMIRVHSRHDNESVYIFAGDDFGSTTRMLIATFGRNDATVIQVKVNVDQLLKWIDSPLEAGHFGRQDHDDSDDN